MADPTIKVANLDPNQGDVPGTVPTNDAADYASNVASSSRELLHFQRKVSRADSPRSSGER